MAQFNVLMVRGFDISVGGLMSLVVVLASFVIAAGLGPGPIMFGVIACLAVGVAVGLANGAMVRFVGVNAVITTIAMLSILQGFALYGRPSPFGVISTDFLDVLRYRIGFAPLSFIVILIAAAIGDAWLYATRSGLRLRAVGFREEAAKRNGVRIDFVQVRAYLLSGLLASIAGLFLASEVGVGHATVGNTYTLTSIAAAVLGGAALTGGRGSFVGGVLGALFFTLTVNIITLLGLNTGAGIIISGALTLFAVMLYSGWEPFARLGANIRAALQRFRLAVQAP
jgi:ribose transport system ATP-binding protein